MRIIHRAGRIHSNLDPISRLRRRTPIQDGPLTDLSKPLTLKTEDDPLKNLYKEIGDRFEEKALTVASAHVIANLNEFDQSNIIEEVINATEQDDLIDYVTAKTCSITISISPEEVNRFINAYSKDDHFKKVIEDLSKPHDTMNPPHSQYKIGDNGLVYFNREDNFKLCVPKDLQTEIMTEIHDNLIESAHAGFHRTYNQIASVYYWPAMARVIKKFVTSCDLCQKAKPKRHGQRGFLQSIPIPSQPFEVITMDFIMDLPESNGYNAILTIVDKLTKYAHFIPCNTSINEEETARLFHNHIWVHYGLPRQVITDRDSRWTSTFWGHLVSLLGITRSLTTAYHPQADGQSEIMNQILEIALRLYVAPSRDNWDTLLPGFTLAYNTSTHTSTGFTPSYLLRGFQPLKTADLLSQTSQHLQRPAEESESAESFAEGMKANQTQAMNALRVAQAHQQESYNKGRDFTEFHPGDLVLISPHSLNLLRKDKGKGRKLLMRYDGPFEVMEKVSDVAYRIRLPASYGIHPVINIAHLESYHSDNDYSDRPKRHLNRKDFIEAPEFEVDQIIDQKWIKKGKRRLKKYKVRFIGYGPEWDEWLTRQALTNAPDKIKEWELSEKNEAIGQSQEKRLMNSAKEDPGPP